MKDFESRWQGLVSHARRARPRDQTVPFGFATRVAARALPVGQERAEDLWSRLALRFLGGLVALLLLCAGLEAPHLRAAPPLESGFENTVAQIVWRL